MKTKKANKIIGAIDSDKFYIVTADDKIKNILPLPIITLSSGTCHINPKNDIIAAHGINALSVAEYVIENILFLLKQRKGHNRSFSGFNLNEYTFCLIGYGSINRRLENILKAFDCRVVVVQKVTDQKFMFEKKDILILGCALNKDTKDFHKRIITNPHMVVNISRDEVFPIMELRKTGCLIISDNSKFVSKTKKQVLTNHIAGRTKTVKKQLKKHVKKIIESE